ncbi:hypothetical protein PGN35_026230 [Nodosilinea sp. PGN35]|uniref:hypothetical protein n=1 Tax=Nodosilinea sp. PGN35 TaxID=3020489 RepID=UPI0023B21C75|nr:hypothetical protein [Nodosilinea sp. TSF1-S3]MDF0367262.1 hypothetical protein [Nodosilinea sp. TSF1-S3]
MRIHFEEWVLSLGISETAKEIFRESITCYRSRAYRASLLFSYIGFQTVLKERLLNSRISNGISESYWNKIAKNLVDDEKWDHQVYECLRMKTPSEIFLVSDDIRHQVEYWKNRRNDCAHIRKNQISHSHVESFWLFVESNLSKLVVGGSREGLVEEVKNHFDKRKTPEGKDFSHLISSISKSVNHEELKMFFAEIDRVLSSQDRETDPTGMETSRVSFFSQILESGSQEIGKSLIEYMSQSDDGFILPGNTILVRVLREIPERVSFLSERPDLIRMLWFSNLFPLRNDVSSSFFNDFYVYCALLRQHLIPSDQMQEAHKRILERSGAFSPQEEDMEILVLSGFFEVLKIEMFENRRINQYKWSNNYGPLLVSFLKYINLDKEVMNGLVYGLSGTNYPYRLCNFLNKAIVEDESLKTKMEKLFQEYNIELPEHLTAMHNSGLKIFSGNKHIVLNDAFPSDEKSFYEDIPF